MCINGDAELTLTYFMARSKCSPVRLDEKKQQQTTTNCYNVINREKLAANDKINVYELIFFKKKK